jgi:hypothetical protein
MRGERRSIHGSAALGITEALQKRGSGALVAQAILLIVKKLHHVLEQKLYQNKRV